MLVNLTPRYGKRLVITPYQFLFCSWSTHLYTKSPNIHQKQSFCFMPFHIIKAMLLSICWVCPSHGNMSVVFNHKSLQNPSLPCGHDEHTENRAKQIQHCLNDCGLRTVRELQNWPSAHEPIMVCCCIEAMLGSLIHGVTAWGGCYSPGEIAAANQAAQAIMLRGFTFLSWNLAKKQLVVCLFHLVP